MVLQLVHHCYRVADILVIICIASVVISPLCALCMLSESLQTGLHPEVRY